MLSRASEDRLGREWAGEATRPGTLGWAQKETDRDSPGSRLPPCGQEAWKVYFCFYLLVCIKCVQCLWKLKEVGRIGTGVTDCCEPPSGCWISS